MRKIAYHTARAGLALIVSSLICPVTAFPQTPAPGSAGAAPKEQAPPLFPKHRRGFYTNASHVEVIDATPQSPPLDVDDPGVPDKGEFEINLLTKADLASDVRTLEMFRVDANYGVVLKGFGHELPAQIKF